MDDLIAQDAAFYRRGYHLSPLNWVRQLAAPNAALPHPNGFAILISAPLVFSTLFQETKP